jgi:hypothetical protein
MLIPDFAITLSFVAPPEGRTRPKPDGFFLASRRISLRLARPETREPFVKKKQPEKSQPLDTEALSAAIAGFLACHVLTLRFLAQEGVIDKDRLMNFMQTAIEEMRPGLADQRSLFVLTQVVNALRTPAADAGLQ